AWKRFKRRPLDKGQRAFRQLCADTLDICVGHDSRRAFELRRNVELVHLCANAHTQRGQSAEVNNIRLELTNLGQLGGEVLLIRSHPKSGEYLAAVFLQIFS